MARFDLYETRKRWWWSFFLAYAAAKKDPELREDLEQMIIDAIAYEDGLTALMKREDLIYKYVKKASKK